jgi:hypothetical protein
MKNLERAKAIKECDDITTNEISANTKSEIVDGHLLESAVDGIDIKSMLKSTDIRVLSDILNNGTENLETYLTNLLRGAGALDEEQLVICVANDLGEVTKVLIANK